MSNKGFAPILIILLIVIVGIGGYFVHTNYSNNQTTVKVIPVTPTNSIFVQVTPIPTSLNETSNWKTFSTTGIDSGLMLKYPPNWVTPKNMFIAEKDFVPGEQDRSKVYNIVEIHKYPTQLYEGSTNSEWFNKIDSLKEPLVSVKSKITKITSGKIFTGEPYVIFTDEPSPGAQTDSYKYVVVYISKGAIIYRLTLDLYDNNGVEVFKRIIASAIFN